MTPQKELYFVQLRGVFWIAIRKKCSPKQRKNYWATSGRIQVTMAICPISILKVNGSVLPLPM